jgi:hypothetical protein
MSTLQAVDAGKLVISLRCSKELHPTPCRSAQSAQYGGIARQYKDKATFRPLCPGAKLTQEHGVIAA